VLGRLRAPAARSRDRPVRRPVRLLQYRPDPSRRSGCNRSRAIRNHPPVRRWQWQDREDADPARSAEARARVSRYAAGLAGPGDVGRRLCARPGCDQVPGTGSTTARDGLNLWIGRFSAACGRAVADADSFEESAAQLQETWRARLGPVRANSAADVLLRTLPGVPIMTVASAARLIGRSFTAVNGGMAKLCEAVIVCQVSAGRRNRAFGAPEVIEAFTALERQLARAAPPMIGRVSSPDSVGRAGAGGSGASRPRSRQVNVARAEGPSTARSPRT
jgi:hypothetical protein